MARRRPKNTSSGTQDRWILSYADFITLLFAFFTTLYAMSVTDVKKAERLAESLRASFGDAVVDSGVARPGVFETAALDELGPAGNGISTEHQEVEEERRMEVLGNRVNEIAKTTGDPDGIRVRQSEEGLVISLADTFFFDSGERRISAKAVETIHRVSEMLSGIPNHVRIEGHTDDAKVSSRVYRSNWHLSVLRAVEVLSVFERAGISAYRLSAAGFADQRPMVSNTTLAGRKMNRRVDIVVLRAANEERGA
ncbi:MAG: OmpA family protein [bacterium]|nr:OmpA family protein [bacterium]